MPRFLVPVRPFVATLSLLGSVASARAEDAAPSAPTPAFSEGAAPSPAPASTPVQVPSRAQFFNALGEQVGFVGALQSWRETLRGTGSAPRRTLWNGSLADGQTALAIGSVGAPALAGFDAGAGTSLSWQNKSGASFDAGTTSRPGQLDQMLRRFDAQTSDSPLKEAPLDRSSVTWLRAKPLSNGEAEVEATLLRAARDGHGEGEKETSGTFESVNARLSLPSKWLLRGSWTNAQFDGQDAASSWNAALNGPLSHPWGQAQVAMNWKATAAGFATYSGANPTGQSGGEAQITQNIQTPLVSGTLVAGTQTQARPTETQAKPGDELARDAAHAGADLRVQLAPALSIKASADVAQTEIERAPAPDSSDASRETQSRAGGDVGVQLQVSKALSLEAGAGLSQNASATAQSAENRLALRVRFAREGENYALGLQTRERDMAGRSDARWTRLAALRVEGERRLIGSWRLGANANWLFDRDAAPGDSLGVARQVGAQLRFSRAARFDVRYRDGAALPSGLSGDPLGSLFSSNSFASANREIATRFNFGSATGSNGLGLALEWARQGASHSPTDSWKIGLTYR